VFGFIIIFTTFSAFRKEFLVWRKAFLVRSIRYDVWLHYFTTILAFRKEFGCARKWHGV